AVAGPLEETASESRKVRDGRNGVFTVARNLGNEWQEPLLHGESVAVQYNLGVGERSGGHDQAFLLDIAKPGFVIADGGVVGHARCRVQSGDDSRSARKSSRDLSSPPFSTKTERKALAV